MPSSDIDLEKLYQEHFSKIYNYSSGSWAASSGIWLPIINLR